MSDYLAILARRAISAPALRPRPRSRFEEGLGLEAAQPEQPVPDDRPAVSPARAAQAAPQAGPPDRAAVQAAVPPPAPYPATPVAAVAPLAPPGPLLRTPRADPAAPAPAAVHLEAQPQLPAVVPLAPAGVAAVRAAANPASHALPPIPAAIATLPSLQGEVPRDQRPALESVTRLVISTAVAGTAPAGDAGQGGRQPAGAAEAPPPAIEIHIGRIEVHAAGEPAPRAPAPQPVQAPATTSLDDYLRERNGRGGRS